MRLFSLLMVFVFFPAVVSAAERAPKPDPRLEQKVSYEASDLQVWKILDQLTEKTGVKLIAGGSSKDWRVRDRRMNIFVKDVPLGELQKRISELMKFRWSRGGEEDKWYYRLWRDKKSQADEENELAKAEAELARQEQEKRQKAFESYASVEDLTPEQIEQLKQDNPFLYVAAKSGVGKPFKDFVTNSPGIMDALMNGREASMKASDLTPAAQQGLMNSMQNIVKMMGGRQVNSVQTLMDNFSSATIEINSTRKHISGLPFANQLLGDISVRSPGGGDMTMPIIDPNSNIAKVFGKLMTKVMEGADMREAGKGMESEFLTAVAADMARSGNTLEKEEPQPDDPELEKKITLKIEPNSGLQKALEEFSKAASMSVISDSFKGPKFGIVKIDSAEITIKEALNKIATGYHCRWKKEGSVIRFQHKDWYKKRAAQIADAWLETWENTLKTTGTLDIEDLAAIATLTDEQINMNLRDSESALTRVGSYMMRHRDLLKLYASLDANQKAMLESEHGLSAHLLTPEQWEAFSKLVRAKNAELVPEPPIPLIVKQTRTASGKQFIYNFTVSSPESKETVSWELRTPEYTTPEEKPQPPEQEKK